MTNKVRPNMVRTFDALSGICNICGVHRKLTEDHTPPKGWVRPKQVELLHVVEILGATGNRHRATRSQNGLKYRTLCGPCNNGLLGATYDPALIEFANSVARSLTSTIFSPVLTFTIQPQAVMRAVLGHMCAQGVDRYRKGPLTETVRDYLLDSTLPFPKELSFYYWAYPYRHQVVMRDAVMVDLAVDVAPVMFWLVKAFPLAFMVTWSPEPQLRAAVHSLDAFRAAGFKETATVLLRLQPLPHEHWPEAPSDDGVVAFGPEAVMASGVLPKGAD